MKMFYSLFIGILTLTLSVNIQAATHLWFWVDGDTGHTIIQGQNMAWELDVSVPGNVVDFELYLDLDQSRSVTTGDFLLEEFSIADGGQDDGPADSSAVPDGIIYVNFVSFGFAPQNYLLHATDEDESEITGWFTMVEDPNPPATISGNVFIEGQEPPDPIFKYIMIGSFSENGIVSALTNENGTYQLNLPAADLNWEINPLFENQMPGYILQNGNIQVFAPAGNTGNVDFYYSVPQAWVYGDLRDQDGVLIMRDGYIGLENRTTAAETYAIVKNGEFLIPAIIEIQGTDSTNDFRARLDNNMLLPDYLVPDEQEDFQVSYGDSVRHDITAYAADTVIYGRITQNGQNPDRSYEFYAWSSQFGYTETESDPLNGQFILHVRNGSDYSINIQSDPQWGTPPPAGYYFEQTSFYNISPGDTVFFNILAAEGALEGMISFDEGDPVIFDYDQNYVNAWDSTYTKWYGSRVDQSNRFSIPVPNGKYHINFDPQQNNYLVMPSQFINIVVKEDTIDTLNFILNYGHAAVEVKLINAPIPQGWNGCNVSSTGMWPYIYETWREMEDDSSIHFNLCEGDWIFSAPIYNDLYVVYPEDTTLTITENDSSAYIEFVYKLKSSIAREKNLPVSFYLNQNYPNPFNPSTTITYGLTQSGHVKLEVYNILGELLTTLVNKNQTAGRYVTQWQPKTIASGVYIYRLKAEGEVISRKMAILK